MKKINPDLTAVDDESQYAIALIGGLSHGNATFTNQQIKDLRRWIIIEPKDISRTPEEFETAYMVKLAEWESLPYFEKSVKKKPKRLSESEMESINKNINSFGESGDNKNMFRHAEFHGMRVMGLLSRFLEPDEDPVHFLKVVLSEAGYDVGVIEDDDDCIEGDEE